MGIFTEFIIIRLPEILKIRVKRRYVLSEDTVKRSKTGSTSLIGFVEITNKNYFF